MAKNSYSDIDAVDEHTRLLQNAPVERPPVTGELRHELTAPMPDVVRNEACADDEVMAKLKNYSEMRVLLVGKSGVGKSSFINALFQSDKVAQVGIVGPETSDIKRYDLTMQDIGVTIKVYDTPGFGTSRKENMESIEAIRKNCEVLDVIFLCIRMDDQVRSEDRELIMLLGKEFGEDFWKKTLLVFTMANAVKPMGSNREHSDREYLQLVIDKLIDEIDKSFKKVNCLLPHHFIIAGAPELSPEDRFIPDINGSDNDRVDWIPLAAKALFQSGCSDNGKAILLKSGWKKWIVASLGAGAGTTAGVMVGTGIVAAGALTAPIPIVNVSTPITLAIGGAIIGVSSVSYTHLTLPTNREV